MLCPNSLNKTIIVSFPRSGHHLLVRGLMCALPEKIVYSEGYKSEHNIHNCDYVNLQKSHDFNLTDPINPEFHYIIQVRGYELAVESWYKLMQKDGYEGSFEQFRSEMSDYYDGFMAKWVNSDIPNRLTIPYHDFVDQKANTVIKTLKFMGYETILPHQHEAIRQWERGAMIKKSAIFAS